MKRIVISIIAAVILASCGTSAHIQSSWRDPNATVDMSKLRKVLVLALFRNETNRRYAESQLAGMLQNKGVASYSYFDGNFEMGNIDAIERKLKKEGFDGVVIMRLADVDKDIKYTPGNYSTYPAYYTRFGPYFQASWNYYSQPGYYATTKTFTIETNVYSLTRDRLVWSSLTSAADPQSAKKLMDAVAKEVYREMKKKGFLASDDMMEGKVGKH